MPFGEVDEELGRLLRDFGPTGQRTHPEYPFWRLQNDGIWEVVASGEMLPRTGYSDPRKSELLAKRARGGFTPEISGALRAGPSLASALARVILETSIPASVHEDLLSSVGLEEPSSVLPRRPRDPAFRERVLTAYERRCAVCGCAPRRQPARNRRRSHHVVLGGRA